MKGALRGLVETAYSNPTWQHPVTTAGYGKAWEGWSAWSGELCGKL